MPKNELYDGGKGSPKEMPRTSVSQTGRYPAEGKVVGGASKQPRVR